MADSGFALITRSEPRSETSDLKIVLTTEGTYPHFRGGVSTWCETLLRGMPEVDYTIWALMMNPFVDAQYDLPDNVGHFSGVPLWGVEEPAEYTVDMPAARVVSLSRRTGESDVKEKFVPLFEELLRQVASADFDPGRFGQLLYDIHLYFKRNDFRQTFRSAATWETFKRFLLEASGGPAADEQEHEEYTGANERVSREETRSAIRMLFRPPAVREPENGQGEYLPTLSDATEGMRWLYRLMTPLDFPIPDGDVVHSSAAAFCGIPGVLAKIERGTPFVVTEHGVYMREQYLALGRYGFPYHLKKFLMQIIVAVARTCFHFADQISPVCRYNTRWEILNGAPVDRIRVIYNGVDPVAYAPRKVSRPNAPTVVSVARIDPLKDLESFLRVAEVVRQHIPNVQFLHFGPVSDEEYDKKVKDLWKELKLENTVKWMGLTDNPAEAFNMGDVTLLSSISEAFPYTVIESMMCGKPVVATNVGGVSEAIEDVGLLARVRDIEGMADGVLRLLRLDAASRAELETACRDRALNRFTIQAAVEGYRITYRKLADQGRDEARRREAAVAAAREAEARELPVAVGGYVGTVQPPVGGVVQQAPSELTQVHAEAPQVAPVVESAEPHSPAITAPESAVEPSAVEAIPEQAPAAQHDARSMMRHPNPEVRLEAVANIGHQVPPDEATRLLSDVLRSDPDARVRAAAASALTTLFGRSETG
jgi:glycosyltransferase involved in cell wall biosynthesis